MKIESDKMLLRAMQSLESILQYASQMAGCGGQTCSLAEKRPPTGDCAFLLRVQRLGGLKKSAYPIVQRDRATPLEKTVLCFLRQLCIAPMELTVFYVYILPQCCMGALRHAPFRTS